MPARSTPELSIGINDESLLVAREALSDGDAVALIQRIAIDYPSGDSPDGTFGRSTTLQKEGQKISVSSNTRVGALSVKIRKYGSLSDSIRVGIQADNSGNPSGTFLASFTKAASAFTSGTPFTESLDSIITLTGGTTYWIVFERTGSLDDDNYYDSYSVGGFTSGSESKYTDGSGVWTNSTLKLYHRVWEPEGVYKAKATTVAEAAAFLGVMDQAVSQDANLPAGSLVTHGLKKKTSWGLTKRSVYYLSDTAGALSVSAGTVSKKIGQSLGTETLILHNTL